MNDSGHNLPISLTFPTLEEAVCELRFTPTADNVVDLLPGVIFTNLRDEYNRSEVTPISSLPRELRKAEPELRYQAQFRLVGSRASIYIGDAVVGVGTLAPYEGWASFRPRIRALLNVIRESKLIATVDRLSMKFVNIIPKVAQSELSSLRLSVVVADGPAPEVGFRLRTELNDKNYQRIVEVATRATVKAPGGTEKEGLLLAIDVINAQVGASFWLDDLTLVDELHLETKSMFFRLITEETLAQLGPCYGES